MSEWDELMSHTNDVIRAENQRIADMAQLKKFEREMEQFPQKMAAEDLHKFLEQYEAGQKAQEKESKVNRWIAIVSMLVAIASMIISLVKQ